VGTVTRPNFFIVGAPKCGTTALSLYLREHPQVFVTDPKEPQYFVRHIYARYGPQGPPEHLASMEAYLSLYDGAGANHIAVGEATSTYLQSKRAIESLAKFNPDAKVVCMVRHPVELARSWHGQEFWEGEEVETDFARAWRLQDLRSKGQALDHDPLRPVLLQYCRVASIGSQLETVLAHFPAEQVKIILLEEMAADPAAVYCDTLDFLGAPDDGRTSFPVVKASRIYRSMRLAKALLVTPKPLLSPYVALKRALGLQSKRIGFRTMIRERLGRKPDEIPAAFRSELIERFEPEIRKVERILDRRLPQWRE
jgi:hypothetical protein